MTTNRRRLSALFLGALAAVFPAFPQSSARRKRLPSAANLPLIRCWNQLASKGFRMLVLRSPSSAPKSEEFDYIRDLQLLSHGDSRITAKFVEGATHRFAERQGKEAVRKYTEQWLSACFPLTTCAKTPDTEYRAPELTDAIQGIDT